MLAAKPSPDVEALILARRGRLRAYDQVDYTKSALIVVDMQNIFVAPGALAEVPLGREIVDRINLLAKHCREKQIPVIWLRQTIVADGLSLGLHEAFISKEKLSDLVASYTPGSWGHNLWPGMNVEPKDYIINKCRFSAFANGSSTLERLLRTLGKDVVIITGVRTNICCESTARDAMMADFKVLFVGDGTAGLNNEEHQATLNSIAFLFGDVVTTEEVIKELEASTQKLNKMCNFPSLADDDLKKT